MEPLYVADVSKFGELGNLIDLVVDGGIISKNKPSTVVKVEGDLVRVLRQGEISLEG